MWALKKAYYRTYQFIMGLGMYLLPWIEPTIIDGANSIKKLPAIIKEKGLTNVLVVTDPVLMSLHMLDSLFEVLHAAGIKYSLYDKVQPNPTIAEGALIECNPTYPVPVIMSKEDCMAVIKSLKA